MKNTNNKTGMFLEKRLIFDIKAGELPAASSSAPKASPAALSKSDAELARKAAEEATAAALKQQALDAAKKKVGEPLPGAKPGEGNKLPPIPEQFKGMKFDQKDAKIDPKTGMYQQPFQFGDFGKGTISLPSNPESGKPTTYLFNYVDDPSKFDQAKFLEELKKRQDKLGNTVIITLKTPEGETQIDKKKVTTLTTLVADIEKFQQDLSKNPKTAGIKLERAAHLLHMTYSDETQIKRVQSAITKYAEASSQNDPRILEIPKILANEPESFVDSLDRALSQPAPTDPGSGGPSGAPAGSSGSAVSSGSPGGSGGGGSGSGSGSGGEASSSSVSSPSSSSDSPGPSSSPDSKEVTTEGVNKLLVLGDSLMVGAQDRLKANSIEKTAVVGKTLNTILKEVQNMDSGKKLETYRNESLVMDGGVNDLAAGRTDEQIITDMKEIWAIAKKYNIKVFVCTLAPFKGAKGYNNCLENNYAEKERLRNSINDQIIASTGTETGPYKYIGLHKKISDGGLADDNDPSALAPSIAAGDKLHLTPNGYAKMAAAIQEVIGQPSGKTDSKPTDISSSDPSAIAPAEIKDESELKFHDEHTPEFYDWAAKINQEFIKNKTPFGTFKVVERNGQKFLAKHTEHDKQASTGKTGKFPATEIYEYDSRFDTETAKTEKISDNIDKISLENKHVNAILDYPADFDSSKPTEIIVYATPDGSDASKSYGTGDKLKSQLDALRNQSEKYKNKNLVLAVVAADTKEWSKYSSNGPNRCNIICQQINQIVKSKFNIDQAELSIDSHSGGGYFAMNILDSSDEIPSSIHSIDFYDSLYWYHGEKHFKKILNWLKSDPQNQLNLISGTPKIFARQNQLIQDIQSNHIALTENSTNPAYTELTGLNGQIRIRSMKQQTHGGTIEWMGLASTKDPATFDIKKIV